MILYFPTTDSGTSFAQIGNIGEWNRIEYRRDLEFKVNKTYGISIRNLYFWCCSLENINGDRFQYYKFKFYKVEVNESDIVSRTSENAAILCKKIKILELAKKMR